MILCIDSGGWHHHRGPGFRFGTLLKTQGGGPSMGVPVHERLAGVRGVLAVDPVVCLPYVVRVIDGMLWEKRRGHRATTNSVRVRVGREGRMIDDDANVRVHRKHHLAVAVRPERTHGVPSFLFVLPLEASADGEHQVEEPIPPGSPPIPVSAKSVRVEVGDGQDRDRDIGVCDFRQDLVALPEPVVSHAEIPPPLSQNT